MKSVMRCIPHALSHNSYYLTSASIGAWKCNRLTDQPTDEHEVIYTSNNPKLFRKKTGAGIDMQIFHLQVVH